MTNLDRFKYRVAIKRNDGSFKVFEVEEIVFDKEYIHVRYYRTFFNGITTENTATIDNVNAILLQCTGVKDCKGTLIYEGDIVAIRYGGSQVLHVVEFFQSGFIFKEIQNKGDWIDLSNYMYIERLLERTEIIGNIYENKELLENE